jgi:hypothetical protein
MQTVSGQPSSTYYKSANQRRPFINRVPTSRLSHSMWSCCPRSYPQQLQLHLLLDLITPLVRLLGSSQSRNILRVYSRIYCYAHGRPIALSNSHE